MPRRARIGCERLESRDTPAAFGNPWPDGQHLTLSFAPDGTSVGGQASNLTHLLQSIDPSARAEILRAFQKWISVANVNVGLVGDGGAAFGSAGAVQGDPRFGDIRVGARALGNDVLAVTAPYGTYDNNSGDIVLNANGRWSVGGAGTTYDLFTVLLQEAGHSFGVGNSPDVNSAMYEFYQAARRGLSAGDVAAIQGLYGARQADSFEGSRGNGTLGTASRYLTKLDADITAASDVDVYQFTGALLANGVTVKLRAAGASLLVAKVELLDAAGRVLASGSASDVFGNDVTLNYGHLRAGASYYVRVSAADGTAFDVGSYNLDVTQPTLLGGVVGLVDGLLTETGLNDTLQGATGLLGRTVTGGTTTTAYQADGGFGSKTDVDYYLIHAPAGGAGTTTLLATVWGKNGATLTPTIEVYDAAGNRVAVEAITADGGTATVQLRGVRPGAAYYLKVYSDAAATGAYTLAADFKTTAIDFDQTATGTLTPAAATGAAPLRVAQSGQVHLVLSTTGTPAAESTVTLVVTAADGSEVGRLAVAIGKARSVDLWLPAGAYRLTVVGTGLGASAGYTLAVGIVTDPTGARVQDTTGTPYTDPAAGPPPASDPPPEETYASYQDSTEPDAGAWTWGDDSQPSEPDQVAFEPQAEPADPPPDAGGSPTTGGTSTAGGPPTGGGTTGGTTTTTSRGPTPAGGSTTPTGGTTSTGGSTTPTGGTTSTGGSPTTGTTTTAPSGPPAGSTSTQPTGATLSNDPPAASGGPPAFTPAPAPPPAEEPPADSGNPSSPPEAWDGAWDGASDWNATPLVFAFTPPPAAGQSSAEGGRSVPSETPAESEASPARDPEAVDSEGESVYLPTGDDDWDDPSLEFAEDYYDDEDAAGDDSGDGAEAAEEAEEIWEY